MGQETKLRKAIYISADGNEEKIEKAFDGCYFKHYQDEEEARKYENFRDIDVLLIDCSDDIEIQINPNEFFRYFTQYAKKQNPIMHIIGLSVEPGFVFDNVAKVLYEDGIISTRKDLTERIVESLNRAGLRIDK